MTSELSPSLSDVEVRSVLVPLDGSESALSAMPTAPVLAGRFGAPLHTISVAGTDEEASRLDALAAAVLGVDVGDDRARVVVGSEPAEVIVGHAGELEGCLVCISTHGRGRLSGAMVGSVARSVLQRSRQPIAHRARLSDQPVLSR